MNTKTLTPHALDVMDQYLHFKVGNAVCSVPYFNNRTAHARASLRTLIGKGSPKDIFDEIQAISVKQHVSSEGLADGSLKQMLVNNNIGIDCSGFAYYVLNAESVERGSKTLDKHLLFVNCRGIVGKMRAAWRPAENCDAATLADDQNSRIIPLNEAAPGDIITMLGKSAIPEPSSDRDHVLVVHQVDYQNFAAIKLYYSHAVAYPEDGLYGTGVKQGAIEIVDPQKALTDQLWSESGSAAGAARIFARAQRSKTELRRLRWF